MRYVSYSSLIEFWAMAKQKELNPIIRDLIKNEIIVQEYVESVKQISNISTKALYFVNFVTLKKVIRT